MQGLTPEPIDFHLPPEGHELISRKSLFFQVKDYTDQMYRYGNEVRAQPMGKVPRAEKQPYIESWTRVLHKYDKH